MRTMEFKLFDGSVTSRMTGAKTLGAPSILAQPIYINRFENGKFTTIATALGEIP